MGNYSKDIIINFITVLVTKMRLHVAQILMFFI